MIICVIGPTCSGKSKLAEEIHKKFNFPIVNFDAFQIYKEMNIGTAKPTNDELNKGYYHFYNLVSVLENFDVSKYQIKAREFLKNNKDVIFVGGTGLYLKAALYDYKFLKEETMPENFLENLTNEELFNKLLEIDKIDALKIGQNNRKRLLRALYIYETHNECKSSLNKDGKNKLLYDDVYFIGLDIDRTILYKQINERVEKMFDNGLVGEVSELFSNFNRDLRAFSAIGYKEFKEKETLNDVKEAIKKNTRNYAKRQMTFFKHQFENVFWFNSLDEAVEYVRKL